MAIQQASFYCPVCQQQRLFTAQNQVNQVFYLILTLFSCGLWGIVWLIQNLSYTPRFHCSQCGHSDAYKYLANPNLRSQEVQQKAEWAAAGSPQKVSPLLGLGIFFMPYIFAWVTLREGYSGLAKKVSFGWLIAVIIYYIFLFGFILPNQRTSEVKISNANVASNSSTANTSPTPAV